MDIETAELCHFCSDFVGFQGMVGDDGLVWPHHATYGQLITSGETCRLCFNLASGSRPFVMGHQPDLTAGRLVEINEPRPLEIVIDATRSFSSGIRWILARLMVQQGSSLVKTGHVFTLASCKEEDAAKAGLTWTPSGGTFSEKVATIRAWYTECHSDTTGAHATCKPIAFTPLRLISTGLDGDPPRLVSPPPDTDPVKYTALSHCWGKEMPLRTTRATLAQFSDRIPPQALSKTFVEAIEITRELGIRYIWIDALCIVQDDHEEWEIEAARMHRVYGGSQLTLAAVRSPDGSGGCFGPPGFSGDGEALFRTKSARTSYEEDTEDSLLVRVYPGDVRSSLTHHALGKRGWTLQEQLLSCRTAWCMKPEIHWGCQTSYQTQNGLRFTPQEMVGSNPVCAPGLTVASNKAWHLLVHNYSGRRFTFPQDRIAAFAGITRYVAERIHDKPILGLWEKTFCQDLAWIRTTAEPAAEFTTLASSLPSWSCLASLGWLKYDLWGWENKPSWATEPENHVKLLDWDIQWAGVPYTSAVTSAHARVEGPVREISIASSAGGSLFNPPYWLVFGEDEPLPEATEPRHIPWRCAGRFDAMTSGDDVGGSYCCLLLRSRVVDAPKTIHPSGRRFEEIFLILEPADSVSTGKYRRVGLGRLQGETRSFNGPSTVVELV